MRSLFFFILLLSSAWACSAENDRSPILRVVVFTGADAKIRGSDLAVIDTYLENKTDVIIKVLRGNREAVKPDPDSPVYTYIFQLEKDGDDRPVQPSESDYSPVVLRPGDQTKLARLFLRKEDFGTYPDQFRIVYFVDEELGAALSVWSGRIHSDVHFGQATGAAARR